MSATTAFALPDRLAAKAAPALIAADEAHFADVARSLADAEADLRARLAEELAAPARPGQAAMERDEQVERIGSRLRTLQRFGLDLCLGRMVALDGTTTYVGRLGLSDAAGRRLLVDWRTPAAEPFFGATHGNPMGLASRRRYRWSAGRISDFWDEVFDPEGLEGHAALDDQSAFVASLGGDRSGRMRDVLATIQSDQDAVIRAGSRGALVVDGGPGTGKTVVALHRAAYLLHADPRLGHRRGGVLFVGPHQPYLAYVADVLPSLGEEGVQTCTLRDLVPQGAAAGDEPDPYVAGLKSSARLVDAVEAAVQFYEEPPTTALTVVTPWAEVVLTPYDWAEAFAAAEAGVPHNDARDRVWEELVTIVLERHDEDAPAELVRRSLLEHRELVGAFAAAWPLLSATDVVGDLWSVPAYLRRCAPWLSPHEVRALQRLDPHAWTVADLPFLDVARQRLGDPEAARTRRRREAAVAAERQRMDRVVDELLTLDDEDGLMAQLRQDGIRGALVDEDALPRDARDPLAGPFAHVVVDEAQELTDAEWQVLLLRCPSRSFTVVGDRAQARRGFPESWQERLSRVGLDEVRLASLTVNYRTPAEVMAEAEPVIRAVLADANVPTSIRSSGVPVAYGPVSSLPDVVDAWLAEHEGVVCVIGAELPARPRVSVLTPSLAKGLEFDLVVLVEPARLGEGVAGAVDRYVAMTRATQQLVVLGA